MPVPGKNEKFFPPILFSNLNREKKRCSKMEEQVDGWLTVLEKNGLGPVVLINP
jgi:hypothetical protein